MVESREVSQAVVIDLPSGFKSDTLQEEIQKHLRVDQRKIAINLTNINFIESAGLGALVTAYKTCDNSGSAVVFFGVQPYVAQLLELTKLNHVLTTYGSETEAIQALA